MSEPRYCKDCRWSKQKKDDKWHLFCLHPKVNMDDEWSLAATEICGTACTSERARNWPAPCGKAGRLWEPKT